MNSIAVELDTLVDDFISQIHAIPQQVLSAKNIEGKWSKKELIGHLIDSAHNNIRRFIVAQYEEKPRITYNQDKWVTINNYQNFDRTTLIDLWYLLNKQAVNILKNIPTEVCEAMCETENVHSIKWLAGDYIKHTRHHLHQLLDLEPFAYP